MLDGPSVVLALRQCGVTHVVWIPDSELGRWDEALQAEPSIELIRTCREGEAITLAAGLLLGGKKPVVCIQCTGMFEAGDALRNVLYDLDLPLFLIIGIRSYYAHQEGKTWDSCPVYTEPVLQAWKLPYRILTQEHSAEDLVAAYQEAIGRMASAVLLAE